MLTKPVTADLVNYLRRPRRLSILEAKDEARLIKRWREDSDREAAPTSHEPSAPCRHTDGHLPYPYGRELTGYEVQNLQGTLTKAKASGAVVLVDPYTTDGRAAAIT